MALITRGSYLGISDILKEYDGGATATAGDLVRLTAGKLALSATGNETLGVALEDFTSASTGVSVNVTPGLKFAMDNDNVGTTFVATHVGARFDYGGLTGAQLVDTSTASTTAGSLTGQLACLEYNPQGITDDLNSDTSYGLFMIAEAQFGI